MVFKKTILFIISLFLLVSCDAIVKDLAGYNQREDGDAQWERDKARWEAELKAEEERKSLTPLHLAVYNGDKEKLKKEIEGAKKKGKSLIFLNTVRESQDPLNTSTSTFVTKEYGINVQSKIKKLTPLQLLVDGANTQSYDEKLEMLRILIRNGAQIQINNAEKKDFIGYLLYKSNGRGFLFAEKVIQVLTEEIPSLKKELLSRQDLLTFTIENNSMSLFSLLLPYYSNKGEILARIFPVNNNNKMIEALINKGADVNTLNSNEENILFFNQNPVLVKYLIDKGIKVNQRNKDQRTPLHIVQNYEVAELLLNKGADINAKDISLNTPLHLTNDYMIARSLIKGGADVNSQNQEGQTPIYYAIKNNNIALIKLLIKNGANLAKKMKNGLTVLDFAKGLENNNIIVDILYSEIDSNAISQSKENSDVYIVNIKLLDVESGVINFALTKDSPKLNNYSVNSLMQEILVKLKNNERIAVATLDKTDLSKKALAYVEESISNESQHVLVERANMNLVLKEMKFNSSDLMNEKKTVKLGNLVGATKIIFVQVLKD